jgi:hypothetical protein
MRAHKIIGRASLTTASIDDVRRTGGWAMSISDHHHSDFEAGQLVLFGAAAIVLLVFAWTFVH